jgi:fused signal recognition particle receptor
MFNILKKVFKRTNEAIREIIPKKKRKLTQDEFEDVLLEADVNYELIEMFLEDMPKMIDKATAYNALISVFQYKAEWKRESDAKPFVDMIVGVNGAGKTTTIAKLARLQQKNRRSVILGASDTFRAAAIEQLTKWSEKLKVPIVSTRQGHDPSAVVYDTISSAISKNIDHVLIDTAGRLHTQTNLGEELKKMVRIAGKAMTDAPHRKMLILDGTQGSSSINQAKIFNKMIGIDGIIITKLDGTAKGGSVLSIAHELQMPIYYIGTGEKPDDLIQFKANDYVNTILDEIFV